MFIQDLNHLEVVNEETNVEGGIVFADAYANANAQGSYFAATFTSTYTSAYTGYDWWSGQTFTSANSSSTSNSAAA
ncbi:hypothetical protein [Planktothrix agardhii]|uniref:hypothetical protein n=1 Tax=Planktothrix agardhii TaxID=1160 RepID=UPI0005A7C7F1|nr:hypothetical protein [Planktothrix agardhii]CAD5915158.1 hypothetical protein NIVACYA_00735 [Planktothrix agardhii]